LATLPRLNIDLALNSAAFVAEQRRVVSGVNRMAADVNRQTAIIERGFNRATAAVRSFGAGILAGLGAGSIGALTRTAKAALDAAGNLGEMAAQAGVSTRQLQIFQVVGLQAGVTTERITQSLFQLNRRIGEAARGEGELAEAAKRYNITVTDSSGHTRDALAVFRDLAERVQNARSATEQADIVNAAFGGRVGRELIPVLAQGAEGFDQMANAAVRAGLVLGDEFIAKADQASDALATFQFAFSKGFQIGLVENLNAELGVTADNLKAITDAGSAVGQVLAGVFNFVRQSFEQLRPFLETTAREIKAVAQGLAAIFEFTIAMEQRGMRGSPEFHRLHLMSSDRRQTVARGSQKEEDPFGRPSKERSDLALVNAVRDSIAKRDFDGALSLAFELEDPALRQDLLAHIRTLEPRPPGIAETVMTRVVTGFLAFSFLTMVIIATALGAETFGVETQWEKAAEFLIEVIKIALLPVTMLVLGFYFGKGTAPAELIGRLYQSSKSYPVSGGERERNEKP
jgi:hypothetical protein